MKQDTKAAKIIAKMKSARELESRTESFSIWFSLKPTYSVS
jgi:hypothetical protein